MRTIIIISKSAPLRYRKQCPSLIECALTRWILPGEPYLDHQKANWCGSSASSTTVHCCPASERPDLTALIKQNNKLVVSTILQDFDEESSLESEIIKKPPNLFRSSFKFGEFQMISNHFKPFQAPQIALWICLNLVVNPSQQRPHLWVPVRFWIQCKS